MQPHIGYGVGRGKQAVKEQLRRKRTALLTADWILENPLNAMARMGICQANAIIHKGHAMTNFDDRANAFENKYAHDADMMFRAEARRNKLVGLWAADLLGHSGDDAAAYAMTVVHADFEEAGIEDVVRKLVADLDGKSGADAIRAKMAEMLPVAKAQLMSEL